MAILTDADGKEVEAFTKEEVEAKAKEAAEAAKAELQPAVEEAQKKVADLTTEIEKLKTNGENAGALRAKTEELNSANADLASKAEAATKAAQDAITQVQQLAKTRVEEIKDQHITRLVGVDTELKKKVQYAFDNQTAGDTSTPEAIATRVQNAYAIAIQGMPAGALSGAAVSGAGAGTGAPVSGWTGEEADFASKFGIKPDTLKKYPKKG